MRDPNRIDEFCEEVKKMWHRVPDWRFGQLMCNLIDNIYARTGTDGFYLEEPDMLEYIREFMKPKGDT